MKNETITLYCYHKPSNNWKRVVFYGCTWSSETDKVVMNNTVVYTQNAVVRIFEQKDFVPLLEWNKQAEMIGWTVDDKSNMSVIVRGRCLAELNDQYTITNLKKDFETITIKAFSNNQVNRSIGHYKVIGT